ncbi:hypothetical protein L596_014351 [Steinernema carpocapsae]|uniref:Centrosomal protein CEP104 N-terminal domain-containing protein n=1 Tax=Steinernema carpocapsae TaxID=34508 RepID=A0A4U5NBP0_STECR|nr:hypothetical protein L596_014351 [Steinernema carpocapsae]
MLFDVRECATSSWLQATPLTTAIVPAWKLSSPALFPLPMSSSPATALVPLDFRVIVAGAENPKEFHSALISNDGWTSEKSSEFPLDIVLGLEKPANIYKIQIDVADENAPSEIDVQIGSYKDNQAVEPNYENASGADYIKKGVMRFTKKSAKEPLADSQLLYVDSHGQFIWLVLDEPNNRDSTRTHISLQRLKIFGYKQKYEKPREKTKAPKSSSPENQSKPKKSNASREDMRFSSEGDGLSMNNNMLAGDPLTSLRIVKKVLGDKRENALKEDKGVEASMCLRAIERMAEYEKRIEKLKSKMSEALIKGNSAMAEKHRLAMSDCRDTVFRAVHIDLLLNRSELRSIGVDSQWSSNDDPQD